MIVSALLTAVGINLGLTLLLFAVFSVLRKQPDLAFVYYPRRDDADHVHFGDDEAASRASFIHRILPSLGWIGKVLLPSEDQLLDDAGLDGVVVMRIFSFSLKVFAAATVLGIGVLLPLNYTGGELVNTPDIPGQSIDFFSISNIKNGSERLWFHFVAAYVLTVFVCYLLYIEYQYIANKRLELYFKSEPSPSQFTVLVRNIPLQDGNSVSDTVEKFFKEYYPSSYLSHSVVLRSQNLRQLITDTKNIYKRLDQLNAMPYDAQQHVRKKGIIDNYEKQLREIEQVIRTKQTAPKEEIPAAFVSFKSRYDAATAINIRQSYDPTVWVTEEAPEPRDVYWPFFSTSFLQEWIFKLAVYVVSILLIVVFLLISAFVQGLTFMEQLKKVLPFLKEIMKIAFVSQVITGYLPSLILSALTSLIPQVMIKLSQMQGYSSISGIEMSACFKMLWFTIWTIFFASVITGSFTSYLDIILNPKNIPSTLAVLVPAQASFFIAYVVTSWVDLSTGLTQPMNLIYYWLGKRWFRCKVQDIQYIAYHSEIPRILLFGLLGLTYFILAPLILPFILVFFCIGYVIYRNQLFNVYVPKYETGGRFWPMVHSTTIFSLVLMHLVTIGIFGVKKLPLASSLMLPLPVLTLIFNEYCRSRFNAVFQSFSTETLIKKDRSDSGASMMAAFRANLIKAYQDPAWKPMDRPSTSQDTTPLLQA